jgi:hypothetical protein
MTNRPDTSELATAARHAVEAGVSLETFMKSAWAAYVDARPGLREQLEREQIIEQLEEIRAKGLMAEA